jgi:hypothetical protein
MILSSAVAEALLVVSGVILHLFIIPTLLNEDAQVPRWQSIPTAIALLAIAVAYISLGLFWPMMSVLLGSALWALVAIYRST